MKRDNGVATTRWSAQRPTKLIQQARPNSKRFSQFGIMDQANYQPVILQMQVNLDGNDVYRKRRPTTKRTFYEPCASTPVRHWERQNQPLTHETMPILVAADTSLSQSDCSHLALTAPQPLQRNVHQAVKVQQLVPVSCAIVSDATTETQGTWQQYARKYGHLKVQIKRQYQINACYYDPFAKQQNCRRLVHALNKTIKAQSWGMFNITDYAPAVES